MNYMEITVSFLIIIIMILNMLFSYFKGVKKSQSSLLITICFYIVFIISSIFLNGTFLLPIIKEKLNVINNQYDSIMLFILNIILKILYFILLYFISFVIEKIITRKHKNKKEFKASIIGFIKGFIHIIILLCILNYNVKSLPTYNINNQGIYNHIELKDKEKIIDLINDYKEGKLINITNPIDGKVSEIMSYSYFDNEVVSLNIELINLINLVDKVESINDITYQNIYELILLADKCECLDSFKDFLSLYIKDISIDDVSLEKEIDTIIKIINEINHTSNINLITSYLYDLKTLDYIVYMLIDNINNSLLNEDILNLLKEACVNKYIHEDVYLVSSLYEYYTSYLLDNDIGKIINNNEFIKELFKSKFVNYVFPKLLLYINELYQLGVDINTINNINIKKEASILIPLAYNLYKGEIVFDKKLLDNVLNSELLSQLLIKSIIDSTFNKGLLVKYSNYIDIPSYLNDINNELWKNELPIIINVFKSVDFNDEYIIDNIVNNISIEKVLESDVIYYSISKILLTNKYLLFNVEDLLTIDNKILIEKQVIIDLFNLLSEFKEIKYQDILTLSNLNLNNIDFNRLSNNQTIRNSLSNLLVNLYIPEDAYIIKDVYYNNEIVKLRQIDKNELLNILNLIKELNIKNIPSFELILDLLINKKEIVIKSLSYNDSRYSKILHSNLSNFIINQIKILPNIKVEHIIEKYENSHIEAKEIISIIQTLYVFKQNNITFENGYTEDMIKNIFNVVIDNPYILDSYIVKDIIDQYMKLYM